MDYFNGVAVQGDGSILLAGGTEGDWVGTNAGENDFVMVALSEDGEELWRWQVSPTCYDSPHHIVIFSVPREP